MGWLNDNVWLFWLGVGLVLAAIEAATVDFVFIMFAGGALAAAVAAALGASFPVQVVVAVGVAVLLLFVVRPIIKRSCSTASSTTRSVRRPSSGARPACSRP
jgi:membrane protein implicated in regulation of membrane protease activity